MHHKLSSVINESGIWSGAREQSHAFLLSPSIYQITQSQNKELTLLGYALYDCLFGLSQMAVIAYDTSLNYGGMWAKIRKVFSTGVPRIYQDLQGMRVRELPKLLKIDLMVDQNGCFRIAEIDGHNKHGLGYSTLGMRFRQAICPEAKALPGAVKCVAEEAMRLGHSEIKLFYADQERFYVPEFEVASQEFLKHGVKCILLPEMGAEETDLHKGLFLDLPFLYHKVSHYDTILSAYRSGNVQFIIPPKPFLGAKGVLALLRNDAVEHQLEAILHAFISKHSLDLVRGYIPETLLVGKQAVSEDDVKSRVAGKRYVLKESISSGMKGTVFSDGADFDSVLSTASSSKMNWILQEEVENQPQTFSWYENGSDKAPELKTAKDWFMRVTVQYVNRKLADVIVTARRDKAVHGAKDCIQVGTIVV